jgi:hypothetical protein
VENLPLQKLIRIIAPKGNSIVSARQLNFADSSYFFYYSKMYTKKIIVPGIE